MTQTQEVTRYEPVSSNIVESQLTKPIDVDRMVAAVDAFHQFVRRILRPGVHYGKMPGVKKDFLWQPGAEEIFRAFNCRPVYETVMQEIDPEKKYVMLWRKCRAVDIRTGEVVGEADAICSSDEFVQNCDYQEPAEGSARLICPEHGSNTGKTWNFGKSLICTGKTAQAFERILPNALMKADKRAFVKAARTLGCASEFFTQDEELLVGGKDAEAPETRHSEAGATGGVNLDRGTAWFMETNDKGKSVFGLICPTHGESKAMEWDRGTVVKCLGIMRHGTATRKPVYCSFSVPMETVLPQRPEAAAEAEAPKRDEPPWVTSIRAVLAEAGHTPKDLELIGLGGGWKPVLAYLEELADNGDPDWEAVYRALAEKVTDAKAEQGEARGGAGTVSSTGAPQTSAGTVPANDLEPFEPTAEEQAEAIDPDSLPFEDE